MSALLAFVAGPIGRWVVVGLLLTAAVAAAGMRLYNAGYAAHEAETSTATAAANQQARHAERLASERMAQLATTHQQEVADGQTKIDRLRGDVRSGARRLSVPTTGVSVCPDPAAPGGVGNHARAELDRATADALVALVAEGDAAIRQSGALIEAYAIAAEVCGK